MRRSMKSHLVYEKVLNPERLKTIKNIEQINLYRDFTNNFSPEGLAKLKPEEILHLNMCEWLEPRARIINERIKQVGGLKIIDVRDGIEYVTEIYKFDLFHLILGDVKPGSIRFHTKGGHLSIPELQAALFDIGEFQALENGYFDMSIQYAGREAMKHQPKTYFPAGTSVEKAAEIIEDAIKNPKFIKFKGINEKGIEIFDITNQSDQIFRIYIEKNVAKYHPINPSAK